MANIHPGYKGLASINNNQLRFTDASINAKQTVDAPDLIMGDWNHDAYNYGKIEVGGSISGPISESFVSVWDWATNRTGCGELTAGPIELWYYCGDGENNHRLFEGMLVNSVGFSCSAGDVAQFTLDVMGTDSSPFTPSPAPVFTTLEKLVTWDKVYVKDINIGNSNWTNFSEPDVIVSNFDLTVSNNLTPVYSLSQAKLYPKQIIPGLRTISGTISFYNIQEAQGRDTYDSYNAGPIPGLVSFSIGDIDITDLKVVWHRIEVASTVGPIVSTLGFTGVGTQPGMGD